ncbi:MAG: site-specific integrase [Clostridia bacterium]
MTGKTELEVREKQAEFLRNIIIQDDLITYQYVFNKYWEFYLLKDRKFNTISKLEPMYRKIILPYFGLMEIEKINSTDIQRFLREISIKSDGLPRSSTSSNKIYTQTKAIFRYAHANGYISKLPTYSVEIIQGTCKSKDEKYFKYDKLVEHFCDVYKSEKYYLICMILLATGVRPEEFFAFRWSNLDFNAKTLKITNAIVPCADENGKRVLVESSTKTKQSVRVIYLGDTTIKLFKQWEKYIKTSGLYEKAELLGTQDYIILSGRGNFYKHQTLHRNIKKYINNNGIYKNNWNFYMFRHSFATYCNEVSVPQSVISQFMGHSQGKESITQHVYINNTNLVLEKSVMLYDDFLKKFEKDIEIKANLL